MPTLPQSVTSRYASNLVRDGRNRDFEIDAIVRKPALVDGHLVGHYYAATVVHQILRAEGIGASPLQATTRALEKLGVTFR